MKNVTLYLTSFLCLFITEIFAQASFEDRAKAIAAKIEAINKDEKDALKLEIEAVNAQLESGSITKEQADEKKRSLAEARAKSIEFRVAQAEKELHDLVQEKVDGKVTAKDSTHSFSVSFEHKKNDKDKGDARTTSQMVFAFGLNHLVTNNSMAHSDFRVWGSHFYEFGFTFNTRILNNSNLLHAKYGLSLQYNNLRPTENRFFDENGDRTNLVTSSIHLEDSRFHNVNLVLPVHLEFDFSKKETRDDKTIFRSHQGFRFGLGGFVGANIKSKQILKFEDSDRHDVTQKTKGGFNVNDLVYGPSAYIGYKDLSIYAKYDINPLFEDNLIDQNNFSFGFRFDFN